MMKKKIYIGSTIGWIIVISNIIFLLALLYLMFQRDKTFILFNKSYIEISDHMRSASFHTLGTRLALIMHPLSFFMTSSHYYFEPFFAIITPLINICLGIGIIRLRNIFRLLFIFHLAVNMLGILSYFLSALIWPMGGEKILHAAPAFFIYYY